MFELEEQNTRILHLDDSRDDAELVAIEVRRRNYPCTITFVQTEAAYRAALTSGPIDIILCDYKMPSFDGDKAFAIARAIHPNIPFLLVTGELGEEFVIERLKQGITDYILKDNLNRLVPAIERALADERKRRELEEMQSRLKAREEQYRRIFEHAATGIAVSDWEGNFIQCNPAYCRIVGYSERELEMEKTFSSLVHPDDLKENLFLNDLLRAGKLDHFEIRNRYVRKSGEPIWVEKFVSVLPDDEGAPAYVIALVTDVSERRFMEQKLRKSEEQYRQIVETAWEGIVIARPDGPFTFVNKRMADMLGYSTYELLGTSAVDHVFEEDKSLLLESRKELSKGQVIEGEGRLCRKDKSVLWTLYHATGLFDDNGRHIGNLAMYTDITRRKQAEAALILNERKMRALFESDMVGMYYWTIDGQVIDANNKFLRLIGCSQDDLHAGSIKWSELTPPEYRQADEHSIAEVKETDVATPYAKEFIRKDGTRVPVIVGAALIDKNKLEGVSFVLDITAWKSQLGNQPLPNPSLPIGTQPDPVI